MSTAALLGPTVAVVEPSAAPRPVRVGPMDRADVDEVLEHLAVMPVESVRSLGWLRSLPAAAFVCEFGRHPAWGRVWNVHVK